MSGAFVGGAAAIVGGVLQLSRYRSLVLLAGLLLCVYMARTVVRELPPRQVPRAWARMLRPSTLYLLWGGMLGAGVLTVVPYAAIWLLFLAESVSPFWTAAGAGALFGGARALIAVRASVSTAAPEDLMNTLPRLRRQMVTLNWLSLGLAGAVLVTASFLG